MQIKKSFFVFILIFTLSFTFWKDSWYVSTWSNSFSWNEYTTDTWTKIKNVFSAIPSNKYTNNESNQYDDDAQDVVEDFDKSIKPNKDVSFELVQLSQNIDSIINNNSNVNNTSVYIKDSNYKIDAAKSFAKIINNNNAQINVDQIKELLSNSLSKNLSNDVNQNKIIYTFLENKIRESKEKYNIDISPEKITINSEEYAKWSADSNIDKRVYTPNWSFILALASNLPVNSNSYNIVWYQLWWYILWTAEIKWYNILDKFFGKTYDNGVSREQDLNTKVTWNNNHKTLIIPFTSFGRWQSYKDKLSRIFFSWNSLLNNFYWRNSSAKWSEFWWDIADPINIWYYSGSCSLLWWYFENWVYVPNNIEDLLSDYIPNLQWYDHVILMYDRDPYRCLWLSTVWNEDILYKSNKYNLSVSSIWFNRLNFDFSSLLVENDILSPNWIFIWYKWLETAMHELWHAMWSHHANSRNCRDINWNPSINSEYICNSEEYGSNIDIMWWNQWRWFDFNGIYRNQMWRVHNNNQQIIRSSWRYYIDPINKIDPSAKNGIYIWWTSWSIPIFVEYRDSKVYYSWNIYSGYDWFMSWSWGVRNANWLMVYRTKRDALYNSGYTTQASLLDLDTSNIYEWTCYTWFKFTSYSWWLLYWNESTWCYDTWSLVALQIWSEYYNQRYGVRISNIQKQWDRLWFDVLYDNVWWCGNWVVESTNNVGTQETCDDWENNGIIPWWCNFTCNGKMWAFCGNGIVEHGEFCDDGSFNGTPAYCNSSCSASTAVCGDWRRSSSEICDWWDSCANDCNSFVNMPLTWRNQRTSETTNQSWFIASWDIIANQINIWYNYNPINDITYQSSLLSWSCMISWHTSLWSDTEVLYSNNSWASFGYIPNFSSINVSWENLLIDCNVTNIKINFTDIYNKATKEATYIYYTYINKTYADSKCESYEYKSQQANGQHWPFAKCYTPILDNQIVPTIASSQQIIQITKISSLPEWYIQSNETGLVVMKLNLTSNYTWILYHIKVNITWSIDYTKIKIWLIDNSWSIISSWFRNVNSSWSSLLYIKDINWLTINSWENKGISIVISWNNIANANFLLWILSTWNIYSNSQSVIWYFPFITNYIKTQPMLIANNSNNNISQWWWSYNPSNSIISNTIREVESTIPKQVANQINRNATVILTRQINIWWWLKTWSEENISKQRAFDNSILQSDDIINNNKYINREKIAEVISKYAYYKWIYVSSKLNNNCDFEDKSDFTASKYIYKLCKWWIMKWYIHNDKLFFWSTNNMSYWESIWLIYRFIKWSLQESWNNWYDIYVDKYNTMPYKDMSNYQTNKKITQWEFLNILYRFNNIQ